ncbi:MAG: ornithine cyclodeaminase family protein [Planctomycetes bacterium]|nr:ornithine cyclodeaminase family protein [Planctomycetota bacterium]
MAAIYLTEADVDRLVDMPTAIDQVEEAFRQLGAGNAQNVPRVRARGEGIVLHSMSSAASYLGYVGWKCYTTTKQGARFLMCLADMSGAIVALLDADRLGQLRTGATTGVAAEWLAPRGATEVGLFGTGKQARTQLAALCVARPIKRAFVYSRSVERREAFANEMSQALGIEVDEVDRPQDAVEDLPVVITATSSAEPVFQGQDLAEGTLICAVGSNWPTRAEIDAATVERADNVVCDSVEACRHEAGDFAEAIARGVFKYSRAVDLAAVVCGKATGRSRPDSIVLFKSVGLALEDVALAAHIVGRARVEGIGVALPF